MKKVKIPLVSVIMPVYNSNGFLKGAIESIRSQTYKNFEFLIVNDGSTDDSLSILKKYKDKDGRIRLFNFKRRKGLTRALSFALSKVRGQFIARQDADDLSAKNRFEDQLKFMLQNDDAVAVGGQSKVIDEKGRIIGSKETPATLSTINSYLLSLIQVQKPAFMIARRRLPKDFKEIESIARLMRYGRIENLPNLISYHRLHSQNYSLKNLNKGFLARIMTGIKKLSMHNYIPAKRKTILKSRFAGQTVV